VKGARVGDALFTKFTEIVKARPVEALTVGKDEPKGGDEPKRKDQPGKNGRKALKRWGFVEVSPNTWEYDGPSPWRQDWELQRRA
jgi:hypothetical protein